MLVLKLKLRRRTNRIMEDNSQHTQPVVFISHGSGPAFFLDDKEYPTSKGMDKDSKAAAFLREFVSNAGIRRPKAVLVLSAHWKERTCRVSCSPKPSLLYDYYGFPPQTYHLSWPVPGAPDVAKRVKDLLHKKGIPCHENATRGLDHGVFVPLMLVFPEADIPVLELSLLTHQKIDDHLSIAEALTELRNDDILIVGSGFAVHAGFQDTKPAPWALEFKTWLHDVVTNPDYTPVERKERLLKVTENPNLKDAHPTIEHFLPLIMAIAAGGYNEGKILYTEFPKGSCLLDHYLFSNE